MNLFNKRPLLLSLFIFAISTVTCTFLSSYIRKYLSLISFIVLSLLLILCLFFNFFKNKRLKLVFSLTLCAVFAFLAFYSSYSFFDKKVVFAESLGDETGVTAKIRECTFSSSYSNVYTASIKNINGKNVNFNVSISTSEVSLNIGDVVVADMSFSPFSVTEYGFDMRASNISKGILTSASLINIKSIQSNNNFSLFLFFNKLRESISNRVEQNGFEKSSAMINALLLGDTDGIDTKTKSNFSYLGISHILSISGTHFTILLGMICFLLLLIGFNKRVAYFILIPILLFYIGLSGFSFSVCRAGIMALMSYLAFLCGRPRDSFTALFISLTIILLIAPYSIYSVSLWLSFTATFTILVVIELFAAKLLSKQNQWYKTLLKFITTSLAISLSVSFSTLPIIAFYYGYFSLATPLANLIIVPLFEIYLYIIPFSVIFCNVTFVKTFTEAYTTFLLSFIEDCASIDSLLIAINQKFVILIASIGIIITLVMLALPLKHKFLITIPSLVSILVISICLIIFSNNRLSKTYVTYFNSGINDSFVITDTNKTMCIDITNGSSSSVYYTHEMIKQHYSTKISAYIFTHYRSNHISAFKKLASKIKIEKVYLPIITDNLNATYMDSVANIAKDFNISIEYVEYGSPFYFEDCEITIFKPEYLKRTSHEIISFFVSSPKDDLLYLGSAFSECSFDYTKFINDAEYIVFGQHYPKNKKKFSFTTNAKLIYGSKDIYDNSNIPNEAFVLKNGGRYNFSIK